MSSTAAEPRDRATAETPHARQREAKRSFYRRPDVAASYDEQRFGGPSGARVNARELRLAASLLPRVDVAADVACGTGRLLPTLRARAPRVVGLDASAAMLAQARHRGPADLVQADAFRLPLVDGAIGAAAALRLLFHFDDPAPLLRELRRVSRPGGTLVCDTCNWSPRGLVPLGRGRWGDRVATIDPRRFREVAGAAGWRVRAERPCFLLTPYLYRRLPVDVVRVLERLESVLPTRLLSRTFWALEAV
jgi:SAM-dependent methyltransferase